MQETKNILSYAANHEGINIKSARAKISVNGEKKEEDLNLKGDFLNSPEQQTIIKNILTGRGSYIIPRIIPRIEGDNPSISPLETYKVNLLYNIQTSSGEITISENQRKALKNKLREINVETEPDDQLLNVYRQLQRKPMEYYKRLYEEMKQCRTDIGSSPCIFVSNELFFGRDYVLPLVYPTFIPPASENVLSCINFLSATVVTYLRKQIPADGDRYCCLGVSREDFNKKNEAGNCSFRNVSFYRVGEKVYTKSSYFEESDSALSWMLHQQPEAQPKWTYRFGIDRDVSIGDVFSKVVSTQICYDLGSARLNQKDSVLAPIHIIQSNTKDIRPYLAGGAPAIPGSPRVIIHADPDWQEVYVPSSKKILSFKKEDQKFFEEYKLFPAKENVTFEIPKEGGRKDIYTLTHWVLNSNFFASSLHTSSSSPSGGGDSRHSEKEKSTSVTQSPYSSSSSDGGKGKEETCESWHTGRVARAGTTCSSTDEKCPYCSAMFSPKGK